MKLSTLFFMMTIGLQLALPFSASAADKCTCEPDAKDKPKCHCCLTTSRTACPGDGGKDALKPYDGKNPTFDGADEKGKTEELCLKEGDASAKIARKKVLAKKTVIINFDGKKLGEKEYTSDCK